MTPDFDNLSVEELFDVHVGEACNEAMREQMVGLIHSERERQNSVPAEATTIELAGPLMHNIDMGNGQTVPMSDRFVSEYRALLKEVWVAPTQAELDAELIENLDLAGLLCKRPKARHYEDFISKYRALLNLDVERVSAFLTAGGSFDQLVMLPTGRSSYTTYTHEFVDELRALHIHYRDLPKAT